MAKRPKASTAANFFTGDPFGRWTRWGDQTDPPSEVKRSRCPFYSPPAKKIPGQSSGLGLVENSLVGRLTAGRRRLSFPLHLARRAANAARTGHRSLKTWLVEVEIQLCTGLCGCWTYGVLSLDIGELRRIGRVSDRSVFLLTSNVRRHKPSEFKSRWSARAVKPRSGGRVGLWFWIRDFSGPELLALSSPPLMTLLKGFDPGSE